MSCFKWNTLNGICCGCEEQIVPEDEASPHLSDDLTEVETRSGSHYMCDGCIEDFRQKYEQGEIDIFDVVG
jgi:hypothetical protein